MSLYFTEGEDVPVRILFKNGGETFIPDANSVYYTVRDNDGQTVVGHTNVAVSTGATTAAVTITVPAIVNQITGKIEQRTVQVKATRGGIPWNTSVAYHLTEWLNFSVRPPQVRKYLGVNEGELPDEDIDLVRAYLQVELDIGEENFAEALSSGTMEAIRANDAIMYQAALQILPGFALRIAQQETNGTLGFQRYSKFDFDRLWAETAALYGDIVADLSLTDRVTPTLVAFSTQIDPFTNA